MRKYATSLILWATIIIGEVHCLFAGIPGAYNWIWRRNYPLTVQWNVWFVAKDINYILLLVAAGYWQRNRINILTLRVFTYFALIDFILYFYNYKTYEYGKVYLWMAAAWLLMYHWKKITDYLWLQLELLINPSR